MKTVTLVLMFAGSALLAWGKTEIARYSWGELEAAGTTLPGTLTPGSDHILITGKADQPTITTLLVVKAPALTGPYYGLVGQVRYDGVEGEGYLEMWSDFGAGGRYFSRTLDATGPAARLTGSSDMRWAVVTFLNQPGGPPPQSLTLNLVLPGAGRVEIGPLQLMQFPSPGEPSALASPVQRMGAYLGWLGAIIGCMGGAIGILCGLGRGRALANALLGLMLVAGVVQLVTAAAWLARPELRPLLTPLVSGGLVCTVLPVGLWRTVQRRFLADELRRMEAREAR